MGRRDGLAIAERQHVSRINKGGRRSGKKIGIAPRCSQRHSCRGRSFAAITSKRASGLRITRGRSRALRRVMMRMGCLCNTARFNGHRVMVTRGVGDSRRARFSCLGRRQTHRLAHRCDRRPCGKQNNQRHARDAREKTHPSSIPRHQRLHRISRAGHASTCEPLHKSALLRRNAFPITDTELKVMAALAMIGLSNRPKNG